VGFDYVAVAHFDSSCVARSVERAAAALLVLRACLWLLALAQRLLAARRPLRVSPKLSAARVAVRRAPGVCPRATGYTLDDTLCRAAALAALGAPPTSDAPSRRLIGRTACT
jgi:hypothetical protein